MPVDALDWLRQTALLTEAGTVVTISSGLNYYTSEATLTADQDPTYTPTFTLKNVTIHCTEEITINFNDAGNDSITIKANRFYTIDNFKVTSIIVTNTAACDIKIFGTD